MDAQPVGVKDPLYKVSSTLNPQAPEFILGCQSSQKAQQTAPPAADVPDGAHFNSLDCPDSETLAVENHQACQDMDSGSLGQREQREKKKKKKRPPGYYNYLEGSTGSNSSGGVDADGTSMTELVNGHALSAPHLSAEDMVGKTLSGAELSTPGPVSMATSAVTVVADDLTSASTVNQRTCDSPDESSLDFTSGAASLSDGNNATSSSSSSSQSSGMTEGGRTADQQPDHFDPQSPELVVSGGHSPCPKSPPPPLAAVDNATATTEQEGEEPVDSGVANWEAEPDAAAASADGHKDTETGEQAQQQISLDSEAQPAVTEEAHSPVRPTAPAANLPKSWASLFHNSKPLPGGPQAFVEVKSVVEVVTPSPDMPELPEKAGVVKESPVPVSEDPMAPKLAGSI